MNEEKVHVAEDAVSLYENLSIEEVWGCFRLEPSRWYRWSTPETELQMCREREELITAVGDQQSGFFVGDATEVELAPLMPDRPVVIFPRVGKKIPSGMKVLYRFVLPVTAGLYLRNGNSRSLLLELPTVSLTTTWFGDMQSGELCYGLTTGLEAAGSADPSTTPPEGESGEYAGSARSPFEAQVSIHLSNTSVTMLDFNKMSVHAEHLSLYRDETGLLTNEIFINFSGSDQVSQVKFGKRSPGGRGKVTRLSGPRVEPGTNFFKRSFSFLKSLTEM